MARTLTVRLGAAAALAAAVLAGCSRGPALDDRPITLDFDQTPAAELIQICADQGGFPVEYADAAAGEAGARPVTLHVRQRPWHEALEETAGKAGLRTRWVRRGEDWVLRLERKPGE